MTAVPAAAPETTEFRLRSSGSSKDASAFQPINVGENEKASGPQKSSTFIGNLRKSITLKRPSTKNSKNKSSETFTRSRSANEAAPTAVKEVDEEDSRSPSTTTASTNFFARGVSNTFSMIWKPRGAPAEKKVAKQPSTVQENAKVEQKENVMPAAAPKKEPSIKFVPPYKYFIENYHNVDEPIIFGDKEAVGMQHAVMISNCSNCAIKITKKVNKVELNNCKKVSVEVGAVISSVDIGNSSSCNVYVTERLPGASVDSCESTSIYIPRSSMADLSIASSGGGSATLYTPKEDEEDEYDEHQIPFQFVHKFQNGKLVSTVSPLYTH